MSKEWINSVYNYNNANIKNLPAFNLQLKSIINSFFFSMFKNEFLNKSNLNIKKKSYNRIYTSNPEIKHNNFKSIITVYMYNREEISFKHNINLIYVIIKEIYQSIHLKSLDNDFLIETKKRLKIISINLRKYILEYYLNKYKFEKNFIKVLENYINKIYMKKIEFNIINLKHFSFSNNIINEILSLKLKKNYINRWLSLISILSRVKIKKIKGKIIRVKLKKNKNDYVNHIENKYKNVSLNFIIKNNLNNLLNKLYYNLNNKNDIKKIIFKYIKYKYIGGLKIKLSGRLTKRYRADKAVYLMKTKGRLRDINSSYKGFYMAKYRGYANSNLEYSLYASKRRIGSYAVKGWMMGL